MTELSKAETIRRVFMTKGTGVGNLLGCLPIKQRGALVLLEGRLLMLGGLLEKR